MEIIYRLRGTQHPPNVHKLLIGINAMKSFFILCVFFIYGRTENENKCMQLTTYGYSYDALYKIQLLSSSTANFEVIVKAPSDAHILFTTTTDVLGPVYQDFMNRGQHSVEIVIGGGRNTFSEIRTETYGGKKKSVTHIPTPSILSAVDFRSFWVTINSSNSLQVGQGNSTLMTASVFSNGPKFQPKYFGISTWNHVKGQWKINCTDKNNTSKFDGVDVTHYTGITKLRRDITYFYDHALPPESAFLDFIEVKVGLQIQHAEVNERLSELILTGRIFLEWSDGRLTWAPEDYDNIRSIRVDVNDIWTPDINTLASSKPQDDMIDKKSAAILVNNKGLVTWTPRLRSRVFCQMDFFEWPHDKHLCSLDFSSIHGLLSENSFTVVMKPADDKYWEIAGMQSEWLISHSGVENTTGTIYHTILLINLMISRKSTSYLVIFSAPFAVGAIMILSSRFLKPRHRGKLNLSCCSAIIMTFFLISLAEIIPKHSERVPRIVSLYVWGILLSTVSILHCVMMNHLICCTWILPSWCSRVLAHPITNGLLCFGPTKQVESQYSQMNDSFSQSGSQDWTITAALCERLLLVIFIIIYISLWFRLL